MPHLTITLLAALLALAACGYQTGLPGQRSPASNYDPVNGEVNSSGR